MHLAGSDDTRLNEVIPSCDSTLCEVHGINSRCMTKAVLYARVSSDAQQKEGTIESQVAELKRQIAAAGHELVKEYIDDGITGTILERPALEQLRTQKPICSTGSIFMPLTGLRAKPRTRPSSSGS